MKIITTVLFLIMSFAAFSQTVAEKGIIDFMRTEENIWNAGDLEGYVNLYTPDDSCRMLTKTGAVKGRKDILEHYKKYFWPKEKMGQLVLEHDLIEKETDDVYYVTGFFHVSFNDGKKIDGRFSTIMKKINGKWYIFSDHSS